MDKKGEKVKLFPWQLKLLEDMESGDRFINYQERLRGKSWVRKHLADIRKREKESEH